MMISESSQPVRIGDEPGLTDYAEVFWKKKFSIALTLFLVSLCTAIISLMMPKTFQASSVLMPPTQNSASGILSSLSSLPFSGLLSQTTDESMSFIAILKSRTVMEDVVNHFDLIKRYDVENIEEAIRALNNNVMFIIEDEGTIRISASASTSWLHPDDEEDVARNLSADMANYYVAQLDVVGKGLKSKQASFRRKFIEKRYNENIVDLMNAEDRLKTFQQKNKMIALPEQTKAAIETAALMKGQILTNEVKLGVMATTLTAGHPEMERLKKENEEIKIQLAQMDYGTRKDHTIENKLFPSFSDVPDLGVKLMRLTRDVEIQNTLFAFLTQQYEEAKIQEAKDTPTIQVLDEAAIPIRKYRPRRMLMVASMFLLTLLVQISFIVSKLNQREQTPST